ncbi:low affinity iron permease family protein [Pigmentiphaga kullae]|uniref:Low affinity Fe/Cu permease n=1 Tax=Pigmentiphaga kullae TaxID=151784 RepID=A0A4Q7NCC3_9BURK|nr:low affinity iron permease family protein [Pigmentiphaga kullae]RZS80681.1 low affinity Fe/Cu permease [Pigmentiphaga kullae]
MNQASMRKNGRGRLFDRFATAVTRTTGSPPAFSMACAAIVLWAALGPIFHFSENWQLVVNTGTTIVTFLMVFVIQRTQNKDSEALHLKLDELLGAQEGANSKLVAIETMDEDHLRRLSERYHAMAERAAQQRTGQPSGPENANHR